MVRISCVCEECGCTFLVHPYRATTARFHSRLCQARYRGRARTGAPRPWKTSVSERFWARALITTPDACWPWTGVKDKDGYGHVQINRKKIPAHRAAYILTHGPIQDTLNVCHTCPDGDNPACVNPAHLWLGTQQDNVQDSMRKGRRPSPSNAKLSKADQEEICRLYQPYVYGQVRLAKRFGVSQQIILRVLQKYGCATRQVPPEASQSLLEHGQRQLTQEQRTEIITLYQTGNWTKAELASCFQTSRLTIRRLLQPFKPPAAS